MYNPDGCYHCESYYFTNRRTGERRYAGDSLDQKPGNLDDANLRPRPGRRGRVAHIRGSHLIQRSLRTGRVWRWRLPPRLRSGLVLEVGSNLVLATHRRAHWRLWRAIPY